LYIVSSAVVLAAFATCSPAQVPPEKTEIARLLALGGERFSIHRTEHFVIASDGDESVVTPLADRLEGVYQAVVRFAEDLKLPTRPPSQPLPVLLFDRHSDFERYARAVGFADPSVPGFFHLRNNTAAFCNVRDLPQLRDILRRIEQAEATGHINDWRSQHDAIVEKFNRVVIQHEAAHQVLFNIGVLSRDADNPDWLVEGLACQFEVSTPNAVNQMRLADFREAYAATQRAVNAAASDGSALRSDQRLLSLADLVADDEFNVVDESKRTIRYAQAWALVDYLHRTHGEALAAYLRCIVARASNAPSDRQRRITEFQSVFGPIDQAFEQHWIESVLKLPYDPHQAGR